MRRCQAGKVGSSSRLGAWVLTCRAAWQGAGPGLAPCCCWLRRLMVPRSLLPACASRPLLAPWPLPPWLLPPLLHLPCCRPPWALLLQPVPLAPWALLLQPQQALPAPCAAWHLQAPRAAHPGPPPGLQQAACALLGAWAPWLLLQAPLWPLRNWPASWQPSCCWALQRAASRPCCLLPAVAHLCWPLRCAGWAPSRPAGPLVLPPPRAAAALLVPAAAAVQQLRAACRWVAGLQQEQQPRLKLRSCWCACGWQAWAWPAGWPWLTGLLLGCRRWPVAAPAPAAPAALWAAPLLAAPLVLLVPLQVLQVLQGLPAAGAGAGAGAG